MQAVGPAELLRFYFRASGRISRQEYALGVIFIYSLNAAILFLALAHTDFESTAPALIAITGLPSTVAFLVLAAKRCHDVGLPGSFVLLLVVPAIGMFWLIMLAFLAGNAGPNMYGAPPRFRRD